MLFNDLLVKLVQLLLFSVALVDGMNSLILQALQGVLLVVSVHIKTKGMLVLDDAFFVEEAFLSVLAEKLRVPASVMVIQVHC